MLVIRSSGGFAGGGINFDAKRRRNSTDPQDLFYAHISGMDAFARALLIAEKILKDGTYQKMRDARYASFDSARGKAFEAGTLSLEDLRAYALEKGEPATRSGQQELYELLINKFI
jgi:xylose isomerase